MRNLDLYRRRLAGIENVCRQDGGDTVPPQAVKFIFPLTVEDGLKISSEFLIL